MMNLSERVLLTLICEAALESRLLKDLEQLKVSGWTISDARGRGTRGLRRSGWENEGNIRLEVVCGQAQAEVMLEHFSRHYYRDFAMICYLSQVNVLRPEKFQP